MRVRFPPPAPEIHFRHLTYKKTLNVCLCLCKYVIYPVLRFSFPNWRCGFDFRRPLHLKLRLDNLARLCLRSHRHEIIESLQLSGHGSGGSRTYRTTSQGTPDLLPRQRACRAASGAKPGQKTSPQFEKSNRAPRIKKRSKVGLVGNSKILISCNALKNSQKAKIVHY
jgi:hypothetical protein